MSILLSQNDTIKFFDSNLNLKDKKDIINKINNNLLLIIDEIKEILFEKENLKLKYAYQPIYEINNFINIYSYKIFAYECLIRNVDYYNMTIFSFLDYFVRIKKSFILHLYFLKLAFENFFKLKKSHQSYLFFNISPEIFLEPNFNFVDFHIILKLFNFPPERVIFEITERYSINLFSKIISYIDYYKKNFFYDSTVNFAIDDFGTGSNNGKFFYELKPEFIKIDRYFVQSEDRFYFLQNIVETFKKFSKIIIEGVETEKEFLNCLNLDVELYQGYFFAKPILL